MLMFDEKAPIDLEKFNDWCIGQISENDQKMLNELSLVPGEEQDFPTNSAAARFQDWETCLRNRIAAHRAPQGKDIHEYLHDENGCFCEIETGVQEAFALKNPLEREKYFDRMRWHALENFESGHHFDFDRLCVYKLKLMLLEKWNERQTPQGEKNLDVMLEKIDDSYNDENTK